MAAPRTPWSWSTSRAWAHDFDHLPEASFPIASLPEFIRLHEQVAGLVAPSTVVAAVALNTSLLPTEAAARRAIAETAEATGLPVDDPVRFGPTALWAGIQAGVESLSAGPTTVRP